MFVAQQASANLKLHELSGLVTLYTTREEESVEVKSTPATNNPDIPEINGFTSKGKEIFEIPLLFSGAIQLIRPIRLA